MVKHGFFLLLGAVIKPDINKYREQCTEVVPALPPHADYNISVSIPQNYPDD